MKLLQKGQQSPPKRGEKKKKQKHKPRQLKNKTKKTHQVLNALE